MAGSPRGQGPGWRGLGCHPKEEFFMTKWFNQMSEKARWLILNRFRLKKYINMLRVRSTSVILSLIQKYIGPNIIVDIIAARKNNNIHN